jgi:hypothetical protein
MEFIVLLVAGIVIGHTLTGWASSRGRRHLCGVCLGRP